jgi:hypothetical protein
MVKGLDLFSSHFSGHTDRFILIGGTACDLLFTEAGMGFRSTKDLDIVLVLEKMTHEFGSAIWEFVQRGRYEQSQQDTEKRKYYRFTKPGQPEYPYMIELFSRIPDGLSLPAGATLTPIPVGEDISSLSGILLEEAYYRFLQSGRTMVRGLPLVGPGHLIALKAKAWINLSAMRDRGDAVDTKNITKHKNDILKLATIADPDPLPECPETIRADVRVFMENVRAMPDEPRLSGLTEAEYLTRNEAITAIFGLQ